MLAILAALIALVSTLASAMAYLITYSEYSHHFKEPRRAVRMSLGAALVAFLFFSVVSAVAVLMLRRALGILP